MQRLPICKRQTVPVCEHRRVINLFAVHICSVSYLPTIPVRNPIDTIHDPSSSVSGVDSTVSLAFLSLTRTGEGHDKPSPTAKLLRFTEK